MSKKRLSKGSLALSGIAVLAWAALAPALAEADSRDAVRSRSSQSASSTRSSTPSGSASRSNSSARSSGSRTSVSRSGGGRAVTTRPSRSDYTGSRQVTRGSRTRGSGHHGHSYRPGGYYGGWGYGHPIYPYDYYRPGYGWSLGLGWWGGYYYGPFYGYRYGYGHPYGYGYGYRYPRAERAPGALYADPVGAFDLNVKPKKTQVWVDGRYVGTVGRFDGFPDYLWLAEGEHQLVFYLDGYETVERRVETLAGVVADLRLDMQRGPSTPAEEVAAMPPPARSEWPSQDAREEVAERPAAPAPRTGEVTEQEGVRDLREEPGRLIVRVEPADASVYLDGRFLGTARDLARLHAGLLIDSGAHRLEVVRPGYADRAVDFSVAAGEEERIEIGLEAG